MRSDGTGRLVTELDTAPYPPESTPMDVDPNSSVAQLGPLPVSLPRARLQSRVLALRTLNVRSLPRERTQSAVHAAAIHRSPNHERKCRT